MKKPKILSDDKIKNELRDLPGWDYANNKVSKEFKLENFMAVLAFIVKLSSFFEFNNHHPDITISYSKIKFNLQRYDIGGKVTDLDIITAKEIEKEYNKWY